MSEGQAPKGSRYREAGVDIDAQYAAVSSAGEAIRATHGPGVVSDIGLFGGLFDLEAAGASGELLVASADGVGTKVRIAAALGSYDSVGRCLVNHCVNDVLVQGARPLFFLDYVGIGKLDPSVVGKLIAGVAAACGENGCALLGGETAEMPGLYAPGDFEIVGTMVGAVRRDLLLDGSRVREGDVCLGLWSSGLHTNGYSLARSILDERGLTLEARPEGLGTSLGEALLAVHRSYLAPVLPLVSEDRGVHACAHITGGGVFDNLPRVLPEGLGAEIRSESVVTPPIFPLLVDLGGVAKEEAWRVWNMGLGFVLVVDPARAPEIVEALAARGEATAVVGRIVAGSGLRLG